MSSPSILLRSKTLLSWDLTTRQISDLELLLIEAALPLKSFVKQSEYQSILQTMRLPNGQLCPIPLTLDVSVNFAETLTLGQEIALRDKEGVLLAIMTIEDIWQPDKLMEAQALYGTTDSQHLGVNYLLNRTEHVYIGGKLDKVELPPHYDYRHYRQTPAELKNLFKQLGWSKIVGYHPDDIMCQAEQALTLQVAHSLDANLLLQPAIVEGESGEHVDPFTQVRCYEHLLQTYPTQTALLNLLPWVTRLAGPKEALWHAIMRKNYGCTHFIVNYQHASPPNSPYADQAAQQLVKAYEAELGISVLIPALPVYDSSKGEYVTATASNIHDKSVIVAKIDWKNHLIHDIPLPNGFSYPAIIDELQKVYPPRHKQGFTIFFTGLSGSGKSTIANALRIKLLERGDRKVTLLDGDVVRKNLSSELTFSKEHRDLNIRRIGFVASEITKNGGIAICAPIAPYAALRREVREFISAVGGFIEVYVATPLNECEKRDRKGLYAKARAGVLKGFTGIDDPYDIPSEPELALDTTGLTPEECVQQVIIKLETLGYLLK